ncbi:peptidoglycan-binding protein [Methylocystis sp. IM3]|uniref:peptidoglycan-binding protein n=2 Tax=unclassified Methylocystis TaxID=2625913 RepID=UPI00311A3FFD
MTKALSRKNRGADDEARGAARAEARRSGKRLGAWLDDAIRAEAEDLRDEPFEDDDDDQVEAIARRLAGPAGLRDERRRERDDGHPPRRWRDDAQALQTESRRKRNDDPSGEDEDRAPPARRLRAEDEGRRDARPRRERTTRLDREAIVADAAAIFHRRIAESERETARALDNLAGLLEEGELSRESAQEGLASLAKRLGRLESRLAEEPAAVDDARPIRAALARLESRLDTLSGADRVSGVERALEGLDQRLDEIARRLGSEPRGGAPEPAAEEQAPAPEPGRVEPPVRRPLDEAVAEITRRQRALLAAEPARPLPHEPEPSLAPAPDRFAAVQATLDSISQQIEAVRHGAVERADQQLVAMRQVEGLRRDLEDMSSAIGDLAPRASVAAIEMALHDLARRVETQRCRGVADDLLEPAERIADELRASIRDLDPSPIVRNLHADVLTIGRRLDALQEPNAADSALIRELVERSGDIREQLSALAARPLPLEKIETRLVDLTQRVDALARSGAGVASKAAAALDMGEAARSIRAIVSSETTASLDTFNGRLERLAGQLDELVASAGGKRIDELGKRIDDLGQMLARRLEKGPVPPVDTSGLENLVAGLARKLDSALEQKTEAPALEEIGRKLDSLGSRLPVASPPAEKHFHDLAQRIDGMRETLSQRFERGVAAAPAIGAIEDLVRGLDRKVETALAAGAQAPDIEPIRHQIEQLSRKVDRLDDPGANPRLSALLAAAPRNAQLDEIAARLERMQSALTHRAEEGSRVASRQEELTELVGQLAARINQAVGARDDGEALKALERQIGALSKRLARNDENGAALAAVEAKIGALVGQLEETKSATSLAAEEAVRRATQEILREASPAPGALRAALERELVEIRDKQDESSQRTHETLLAVHETLERVVERLAMFEDELTEIRGAAKPAAAARAPGVLAEPRASSRIEADDDDLGDFLMPPGAARPQRREPAFETGLGGRPEPAQMDFIAAARRAAQQAARDAAAAETAYQARRSATRAETPAEEVERAPEGKGAGLLAAIQDRKRPLLLGLGALVLMAGAYQIARVGIEGVDNWRKDNHQHAEATPEDGEAGAGGSAPAAGVVGEAAKNPAPAAPARPRAAVPDATKAPAAAPAAPPPRMIVPNAETAPVDRTPVGSIGGAALNPLPPPDAIGAIRALAEGGDAAAQYDLALRMSEGRGLPRDPRMAAQWFERAAAQGLAPAMYRLGSLYEKGVGVERDYSRARKLYQAAAEAGNARAMHNLAVLFAEGGDGGKPDYGAAAEWFRKAGEYGVRDSQYNLAILHARGLGVGQSLVQSYVWFSAAAAQGDADAARKRDEVASRLDSKELAAAKAAAAAFHVKEPPRASNDVPPPVVGGEKARVPGAAAPVSPPPAKPKISRL